ncbi:MAG: hypothetical protein IJC63_01210, partial [Myxococcaceae bacterium]|nr:hypothetical protein [Myxococcaceae bacterium]
LNVETGAILLLPWGADAARAEHGGEDFDEDELDDPELANFLRNEGQYMRLPDRSGSDGYRLIRDFAWSLEEAEHGALLLRAANGRRPARRFRDALRELGLEQRWLDYKEARLLKVAREWCDKHGVKWAYRFPESVLARRRFTEEEIEAAKDAPVAEGDETFNAGILKFNYTTLTAEIKREGRELEEVELDVGLWLRKQGGEDPSPPEGYELWGEPLLLELSPDRRLVAPDDDHALLWCCGLVDAPVWLHTAKREGRKTLKARLVPMEVHERHICKGRAQYMARWNSECDDMAEHAKRKREREQR